MTALRLLTVLNVFSRSDANGSRCLLRSRQMRMDQAAPAKVRHRSLSGARLVLTRLSRTSSRHVVRKAG